MTEKNGCFKFESGEDYPDDPAPGTKLGELKLEADGTTFTVEFFAGETGVVEFEAEEGFTFTGSILVKGGSGAGSEVTCDFVAETEGSCGPPAPVGSGQDPAVSHFTVCPGEQAPPDEEQPPTDEEQPPAVEVTPPGGGQAGQVEAGEKKAERKLAAAPAPAVQVAQAQPAGEQLPFTGMNVGWLLLLGGALLGSGALLRTRLS